MSLKIGDEVIDDLTGKITRISNVLMEQGRLIAYIVDIEYLHEDRYPWEITLLTRQVDND